MGAKTALHATAVLGKQRYETKPDISLSMLLSIINNVLEATWKECTVNHMFWTTLPPVFEVEAGHTTIPVP
jgi:hypothetical protein